MSSENTFLQNTNNGENTTNPLATTSKPVLAAQQNKGEVAQQPATQGNPVAPVAGQTTDHINLGSPNKDEQIEVRTPNFARQNVLHLLILFGIIFVIFTFVFQVHLTPVAVIGRSMLPTLNVSSRGAEDYDNTDLIYIKPCSTYKNGDIIVTDSEAYPGQSKSIIKRVIATEGQTITFKLLGEVQYYYSPNDHNNYAEYKFGYTIWLDDVLLDEEYINETNQELTFNCNSNYESQAGYASYRELCESVRLNGEYSVTIQPGYVFVMGDNRQLGQSHDSRYFGPIQTKHIVGKLVIHIPYGTNFFVGLWNAIFKKNNNLIVKLKTA